MAFFGLTYVGYQEPFQQRKLALAKYEVPVGTPQPKLELFYPKLPPIGAGEYDGTEHRGSNVRYRQAVRWRQLKKNPNQIYRVPMTCGQDIGWWLPSDPSVKPENVIPWMKVQRHPLLQSPITKFRSCLECLQMEGLSSMEYDPPPLQFEMPAEMLLLGEERCRGIA